MRIQHNIMAMNAYRNYTNNVAAMKKNLEKLSSGYKINRAGDDAAGLAISEKMRAQITGLETAQKNAKDGISLVQTAEGALTEVHDMLNRMVELATQSANGTYDNTTDRFQMQKEVDQLLSEINRIADSSNFNGINLLDGTLGFNTDAFEISDGDAFTEAVAATTQNLTVTATHGGESVTAVPATFTVDLKALEVKIKGKATETGSVTVTVAGVALKATGLAGTTVGTAAGTKTHTATAVGAALKTAYTGTSAAKSLKIGDAYFKASNTGSKVTFTYVGYDKNGTFTADANGTGITKAQADALNSKLNAAEVSVTAGSKATINSANAIDHGIEYTAAVAEKEGGLLGGKVDITNLLANGAKLTVEDATFTVKLAASATNGGDANTLAIDTNKFTTKAAQLEELKRLLADSSSTNYDINTASGAKISIDQKVAAIPTSHKSMADVAVKLTTPTQAAKAASTKLTVTASAIQDGNTISITDGSVTTKYVFGKGTDVTTGNNRVKYVGAKTVAALAAKIDNASVAADGKTINIKAAKAAASVGGPTILGKGLTLQIGDTSDNFNQLNVLVQDMHAKSLGLDGLKINTEESAQKAIKNIKDAINTVSDVRGTLGATQNRLDHTINNLSVMTENIQDAESTIRDTDVAEEMMAYTKNNILIQSAQAMLAQANQVPQGVLQLLQ